jgi:CheY-like chemotaxis protein
MAPGAAAARAGTIVLAADDQADNILLLESLLESQGYTFIGVGSGKACLAMAERISPRLILLDVQMPVLDGYETCRRLRAIPALARVPVAFLTARKAAQDVRAGVAAGGDDFIVKPFDPARLIARVAHWTGHPLGAVA